MPATIVCCMFCFMVCHSRLRFAATQGSMTRGRSLVSVCRISSAVGNMVLDTKRVKAANFTWRLAGLAADETVVVKKLCMQRHAAHRVPSNCLQVERFLFQGCRSQELKEVV